MLNQPDKYSAAILGKPPQEYVQWIRDPKRWGGSIEIQVLAEYFKVQIVAIDIQTLTAHIHGDQGADSRVNQRCFLLYSGVHYDALVFTTPSAALKGHTASTQTEADDVTTVDINTRNNNGDSPCSCSPAAQVGTVHGPEELQLQCLDALKFRGRQECVNHAQETGHQNFGSFERRITSGCPQYYK